MHTSQQIKTISNKLWELANRYEPYQLISVDFLKETITELSPADATFLNELWLYIRSRDAYYADLFANIENNGSASFLDIYDNIGYLIKKFCKCEKAGNGSVLAPLLLQSSNIFAAQVVFTALYP